jgi:hypothetical protein
MDVVTPARSPIPRIVGIGILIYGAGTFAGFVGSGSPGGDYSDAMVLRYIRSGHLAVAFGLWYLVALSALGLLVAAPGLRELRRVGGFLAGLATAGAAISVAGAFVSGGVAVAVAEGGTAVRSGVGLPALYTLTGIGNLLAVCAPALCMGVAALVLAARGQLPTWLRIFTAVAGVCGILAPFFFTYFVYAVWTVVAGIVLTRRGSSQRVAEPEPSLV